ncbi:hypothetical protein [Streptomyces sp. NBC_00344]|uniref:hypothetical protein n=1 Tax=Streptomyces sp. NBC_00344 TaxID=2975720 RepID=UPI002E1E757A
MGIESDQLVYDYLSRVGDLAQRQLSSGDRMRLVSALRGEIDRQRAGAGGAETADVLRILGRLGTPAEQVAAAAGGPMPGASPVPEPAEVRGERARGAGKRETGDQDVAERGVRERTRRIPRPLRGEKAAPQPRSTAARPPHLAGEDELGPSGDRPDWWRIESGPFGPGDSVPGFTGGVEIPEILRPPDRETEDAGVEAEPDEETEEEPGPRRRFALRRRLPAAVEDVPARRAFSSPYLLFAAAVLVAGVVLGNLLVLGVGWLLAYASRRLSRAEAKWAVLGLPGLAAVGGLVWLWGRSSGRWGTPIPAHGMADALTGVWPVVLRVAAGASALYLVWRARRPVA